MGVCSSSSAGPEPSSRDPQQGTAIVAPACDPDAMETARSLWAQLTAQHTAQAIGDLFYEKLFAAAPSLRSSHFRDMDVSSQGLRFVDTFAAALAQLHDSAALNAALRPIGERHAGYGVLHRHYAVVGAALLATVKECLPSITPADEGAWRTAFEAISAAMQRGARTEAAKRHAANYVAKQQRASAVTPEEAERVLGSWDAMLRQHTPKEVGDMFYQVLFDTNPDLPETLFGGGIEAQARRIIIMLDTTVRKLGDLAVFETVLLQLGGRHVEYKVSDEHYRPVGVALIGTLRSVLGDGFTAVEEAAWRKVYYTISAVMQRGAAERAAEIEAARAEAQAEAQAEAKVEADESTAARGGGEPV